MGLAREPTHISRDNAGMCMKCMGLILAVSLWAAPPSGKTHVNSAGMKFVRVEAGNFRMGESATVSDELLVPLTYPTREELRTRYPDVDPAKFRIPFEARRHGDFDEHPVHRVRISRAFYMGGTEVTNAQYELFDPAHRSLRGKSGFSREDDEAVVFVSWQDAKAFCEWLSRKEGLPYRLPTEAEWEYAARAGSTTLFYAGDRLPPALLKNAHSTDFRSPADIVSLAVGRTPPNAWGLFDMHGNVEEWTEDWYGPYRADPQTDPAGPAHGDFRVTRGGSHGTDPYYLRSANRGGAPPETRNWIIGFRVVAGGSARPAVKPDSAAPAATRPAARQEFKPTPVNRPYFRGPRRFVRIPPNSHGPLYAHHNHDTAIAECPNGDMLAIWYTCEQERGRELAVASSRLPRGAEEWEPAQPFWDAPDRNDHCPALWYDGDRTLYHINGLGVAGRWEPLAILMRTSTDSGKTWSKARLIVPEFGFRNMVGQPVFRARGGSIVFGADASGGTAIWVSHDEGGTWNDPGGTIRGIHAGIVQLFDGRLLALGRGQEIDGWMAMSVSGDMGKTWVSRASSFPPIGGGQRAVLMRLRDGPLLYAGFAKDLRQFSPLQDVNEHRGAMSLFAALSYDEGKTWPVRRIITDGLPEHPAETIDGGRIRMSAATSEPQGYLAATQARSGVIHVISSVNHYAFNKAWLEQPQKEAGRAPQAQTAPRVAFTIEAEAASGGTLELWEPSGALITNHYRFAISAGSWRVVIRDDTAAQAYHGDVLTAVLEPEIIIDWRLAARGRHLQSSGGVRKAAILR